MRARTITEERRKHLQVLGANGDDVSISVHDTDPVQTPASSVHAASAANHADAVVAGEHVIARTGLVVGRLDGGTQAFALSGSGGP